MAFTITGVNRDRVPENGGYELQITGTFDIGNEYLVFVGDSGSVLDSPCYSGKTDQGNVIYPWTATILRCYTPILPPDTSLHVTVRDVGTLETHTLLDILVADYQHYHSTVFDLRKVFPPIYKMGARSIDQSSVASEIAPLFYSDQVAALQTTTVKVAFPIGNSVTIYWGDGSTEVVVCDGTLKTLTHNYTTQEYFGIYFTGNYDEATQLDLSSQAWIVGSLLSLAVMVDLTELYLQGTTFSGNLSSIAGMTGLTNLDLNSLTLSGDISNLVLMTSMVVLYLNDTSVSGNISNLAAMTSLTDLQIQNTSVVGDLANFSGMASISVLYAYNTACNIYTTGALPAWANADIKLNDVGCDSMEVDDFLNDLASGCGANGSLEMAGTNAARTSGSDASVIALLAAGWSITVHQAGLRTDQAILNTTTVKLNVPIGDSLTIHWGDNTNTVVVCDGVLNTYTRDYAATGYYGIWFEGDYDKITELDASAQTWIDGELVDISGLVGLTKLNLDDTGIIGSIADLSSMTSMINLGLDNTVVTGNVSNLSGMTGLVYLRANTTSLSGNLSSLSGLTSMQYLWLNSSSITGDISNLAAMTAMVNLQLYDTSVSGNISNFAAMTSMATLYVESTSVSGDLTDLATLTVLTTTNLSDTACNVYTTGALPAWANNVIQIQDVGLDSVEVDAFLIDLAAGVGANGSIDISGSNAARTILSDAAVGTLIAAGWSVTANEPVLCTDQVGAFNTLTVKLKVPATNAVTIHWGDNTSTVVVCDDVLNTYTRDYVVAGYYGIWFEGDVDQITGIESASQAWVEGYLEDLSVLTALTSLSLSSTSISGNISGISGLTSLSSIFLSTTSITGDISGISALTSLTVLFVNDTVLSGNLSSLAGMTSMAWLYLYNTSVTGDISNLSAMTSMAGMYLYNTTVSGNISNLVGMTAMLYLSLRDTSVTGDISNLTPMTLLDTLYLYNVTVSGNISSLSGNTALTHIYLSNTSVTGDLTSLSGLTALTHAYLYDSLIDQYTTGALPPWASADLQLYDLGLDSVEVDNFIIDLASGVGVNGILKIDGTNAARTILSDAAVATLVGAGWSVTANEPVLCTDQIGAFNTATLKLQVPATNAVTIHWGDNSSTVVVCDDVLNTYTRDYVVAGYYGIWFEGDYNAVTRLEAANQAWVEGDLADLAVLTSLTSLSLNNTSVSGNLSGISGLTSMVGLYLQATSVTGDISNISGMTSLTTLHLDSTSASGNLSSLSGMTSMAWLYLYSTSVTGDIVSLAGMTNMVGLYAYSTTVSGNISNLVGMTSMAYLNLRDTSVTGDISNLTPMTLLATLYLYNTTVSGNISSLSGNTALAHLFLQNTSVTGDLTSLSGLTALTHMYLSNTGCNQYTSGALPAWANNDIRIYNNGLDSNEVDNFIIDLASGVGTNGRLSIGGTNAARSIASDAAVGTLEAAGWTVTANEPVLCTDQSGGFNMVTTKFIIPATNALTIYWGDGASTAVVCDGVLNTYTHTYTVAGYYGIWFDGDVDQITRLEANSQAWIEGYLADLAPLTALTILLLNNTSISGSLSGLSGLTSMVGLYLQATSVSGDVSNISGMTSLTTLHLDSTSASGNLSSLSGMTSMQYLYLYSSSIIGSIASLSGMTDARGLQLLGLPLTGDISNLSGMTNLTTILLYNTSVSGDLDELAGLTSLGTTYLYNTSCDQYTTGALPAWASNNINISSNGLDSMEVDDFIIDLANGVGSNGTLVIDGTNAARTIHSDAAVGTLEAAGWTVTANEPVLCTDQTGGFNTVTIKFIIPGGNSLTIHWGDNTSTVVVCDGALNTYTHDYGSTGYYGIWFEGDADQITGIESASQAWVEGDLADLAVLTALTALTMYSTSISGNISGISGLTGLTSIRLYATNITGNLSSLSGMTSMTTLYLYSTSVTGDIVSLAGMTNMVGLYLYDTTVSGNISNLVGMTSMAWLRLYNTSVTGDIVSLAGMTNMVGLYLYSTTVSGDISSLSSMSSLSVAYLYSTSISGNLSSLSALTSLTILHLAITSVTGNISSLSGLTSLTRLALYTTSVSGNLSSLVGMASMNDLRLNNTSITGDISNLASMTSMVTLRIESTSVLGDLTSLATLVSLTSTYLYSTSCDAYTTGALPPWANNTIQIQDLGLDSNEVDDFINDLAAGVGASVDLYIGGTNAARSIASDAGVATIIAAGGTVDANEPVLCTDQSGGFNTLTVKLKVPATNSLTIHWGDNTSSVVTCDDVLNTYTRDYLVAGYYGIWFEGDEDQVTALEASSQAWIEGDIADIAVLTSLTYLALSSTSTSEDISGIAGLTSLTHLDLGGTSVTGNLTSLSSMTSMVNLYIYNTSITGDISNLASMTSMAFLYMYTTTISGNISNLSGMTSLSRLYAYSSSITGNISSLAGLTSLTRLRVYSTALTGDLDELAGLTLLTILQLYSSSCDQYTTGALPAWAGTNLQIYSIGLDATEVDNFIIDLAAGVGANGTLNIAGSNATRTSASDTAKAALITAGWSVTVNE